MSRVERGEVSREGCGVFHRKWLTLFEMAALSLACAALAAPASAQHLETIIESRGKDFPGIGAGVMALKRDSAGRYYILAKPATEIRVYSPEGDLIGQIPNAKSNGAKIVYAVDIDLSPEGQLYVADRGANCIEVFGRDGSVAGRIPVVAPTSIVALSGGQVAVTSMASKRLVQIIDSRGKVVRGFGDVHDLVEDADKQSLINLGKISGDSAGGIYFAFTSVPDRTLRKYDRYGYVGYEASVSERLFAGTGDRPDDRVEVGFGYSEFSLSDQANGWATFGSSGDLKFGAGLGTGLGEALRHGGFGQAIQQQSMAQNGPAGGAIGAQFTGQVTNQGLSFQPLVGPLSGSGGRGRNRGGFGSLGDQTTSQGPTLQFLSSGGDFSGGTDPLDIGQGGEGSSILSMNAGTDAGTFASSNGAAPSASGAASAGPGINQQGLPDAFVVATLLDSGTFGPQTRFGGFGGGRGAGGGFGGPGGFEHFHGGGAGAGFGAGGGGFRGPEGGHGGYHGRFGSTMSSYTSRVRVNLGDLGGGGGEKPVITAMAADPETQEIWAAMGGALVRFSKEGDLVGMYYPTIAGATRLKPVAVLVEPDRILVAADPWGIFEFARPDKAPAASRRQLTAAPLGNATQN